MQFRDEFEYEINGKSYYVEVVGIVSNLELLVNKVDISDDYGLVDDSDVNYEEIVENAKNREYEVEIHDSNFDYYNYEVDSFLRESNDF